MNAVEKIKTAAAKLDADEQYELFRWWVESDTFKQRQLAALRQSVAVGIADLENGRFQTYTDSNLMELKEEVVREGKKRLASSRKRSKE